MFKYVILLCNPSYPSHPIAFTDGMAEAMDIAINAKTEMTGSMVDNGDNYIAIKRKLY